MVARDVAGGRAFLRAALDGRAGSSTRIHRGNVDAAEECFSEITPSDDPYGQAMSRLNEATIAFRRGELARARSLLDAAEAFADSQMAAVAIDDRFELDWLREQLACAAS